jgi:hypothetical protein
MAFACTSHASQKLWEGLHGKQKQVEPDLAKNAGFETETTNHQPA